MVNRVQGAVMVTGETIGKSLAEVPSEVPRVSQTQPRDLSPTGLSGRWVDSGFEVALSSFDSGNNLEVHVKKQASAQVYCSSGDAYVRIDVKHAVRVGCEDLQVHKVLS